MLKTRPLIRVVYLRYIRFNHGERSARFHHGDADDAGHTPRNSGVEPAGKALGTYGDKREGAGAGRHT